MSDIVLTAGVRSNLLQLQKTADLITNTQTKLATGKRVNSALDNPINFFTAQGLTNRANDLGNLLDSMSSGINTIQAANNGITSITKLVQSAQALVSQAQQTTDTTVRASLATQFNAILAQIDQLGRQLRLQRHQPARQHEQRQPDAHAERKRHVDASPSTRVNFTLDRPRASNNCGQQLGDHADITAASTDLTAALTTLRSQAQSFGSNLSTVQIRQDFTKAMINTLQTGADGLTLADSNEEGANLLALQTRQQLSTTALSLASQASQAVLRLFQ